MVANKGESGPVVRALNTSLSPRLPLQVYFVPLLQRKSESSSEVVGHLGADLGTRFLHHTVH